VVLCQTPSGPAAGPFAQRDCQECSSISGHVDCLQLGRGELEAGVERTARQLLERLRALHEWDGGPRIIDKHGREKVIDFET
jgi:hypothetical protein